MQNRRFPTILLALWLVSSQAGLWPAQAEEKLYSIMPSRSSLTILVGKAGALSGLGHEHVVAAKALRGQALVPINDFSRASFALELDAASLSVADQGISDKDRNQIQAAMQVKVLEASRFPKISFRSVNTANLQPTADGCRLTINGDLSLHGAVKRIALPVVLTVTAGEIRVTGRAAIKQTDFGIKPYSVAGGAVKVKDELKFEFTITAGPTNTTPNH